MVPIFTHASRASPFVAHARADGSPVLTRAGRWLGQIRFPSTEGVAVSSVAGGGAGRPFQIQTSAGEMTADHVIVATGGYHDPFVPEASARFPSSVVQLHSRDYSNPASLPDGEVLVVGTGQSGCQIAEDLLLAGRKVHLSVGNAPRCARRYRGKDVALAVYLGLGPLLRGRARRDLSRGTNRRGARGEKQRGATRLERAAFGRRLMPHA